MGSGTKGVPLLALACLLIATTAPVLAQTTTGRILGTVPRPPGEPSPPANREAM